MKRATLWIVVLSACALAVAGCGGGGHLKVAITTAPTTLAVGASNDVTALVTHDHAAGGVTWSCAPVGACGSFDPTQTPSGTPSTYTAPVLVPTGGTVTITATSVTKPSVSASVTVGVTGQSFAFFASGEANDDGGDLYSIAGVVSMAADGTIAGGEQDFNDGVGGLTSPEPSGDLITGGSLVMAGDGSGNGVLTLTTDNENMGVGGTETFAVVFANPNHALIVQFDGSATSFGSMDLQTATSVSAGSFAFTASGLDPTSLPVDFGGVLAIDSSGNVTGFFDETDGGVFTPNTAIQAGAAVTTSDAFGRGTVTGATGPESSFNFYVVGPEVIRVIDVNTASTAIGSVYGQGSSAGAFTSASIGASVFSVASAIDSDEGLYAGVGEFFTPILTSTAKPGKTHIPQGGAPCSGAGVSCSFSGVADVNELGSAPLPAQPFTGSFSLSAAGNGFITIDDGDLGNVVTLGVYAVDPALNILDPNDTTDSTGGALVAEMDGNLVGTGSLVPQPSGIDPSDFFGAYAFGAQGVTDSDNDQFDFVGAGTVDDTGAFSGVGALSDPFAALSTPAVESTAATFNGTALADENNAGRFTIDPLTIAASDASFATVSPNVTLYEANASQFFWIEMDDGSFFSGPLETSTSFAADAAKRAHAKAKTKTKTKQH